MQLEFEIFHVTAGKKLKNFLQSFDRKSAIENQLIIKIRIELKIRIKLKIRIELKIRIVIYV